jgi:hypothetical protein
MEEASPTPVEHAASRILGITLDVFNSHIRGRRYLQASLREPADFCPASSSGGAVAS